MYFGLKTAVLVLRTSVNSRVRADKGLSFTISATYEQFNFFLKLYSSPENPTDIGKLVQFVFVPVEGNCAKSTGGIGRRLFSVPGRAQVRVARIPGI